jgi:Fe-S oxidoreductase
MVIHHTQLIQELLESGRLKLRADLVSDAATFHDPCYLGRQNGVFEAPRASLRAAGLPLAEMPRHGAKSFCCGAGGAQMWKEEEAGEERVSSARLRQAEATGAQTLAVGCPFCMLMLTDASRATGEKMQVRDVAEIIAERLLEGDDQDRAVV